MKTSASPDFKEALYVLALDLERFDVVHKLIELGFSARVGLDDASDLTPAGLHIYDGLGRLFAMLADDKKPEILVTRRPKACHDVASGKPEHVKTDAHGLTEAPSFRNDHEYLSLISSH